MDFWPVIKGLLDSFPKQIRNNCFGYTHFYDIVKRYNIFFSQKLLISSWGWDVVSIRPPLYEIKIGLYGSDRHRFQGIKGLKLILEFCLFNLELQDQIYLDFNTSRNHIFTCPGSRLNQLFKEYGLKCWVNEIDCGYYCLIDSKKLIFCEGEFIEVSKIC